MSIPNAGHSAIAPGRRLGAKAIALFMSAALLVPSLALAQASCECKSTLDKIKEAGVFKAGVRFDSPPMGYVDGAGKPAGFGADVATEFARRLGVRVEFVEGTSRTRIPLLLNGSYDAEIGTTSPTVEREKVLDFTIPYFWDSGSILVRKGDSTNPKDYGAPKKIAVTQGSFFVDLYKALRPDAQFTVFQEYTDSVAALQQKRVDAVLINRSNAVDFAKHQPNLVVGGNFVELPIGIAIRQNDSKWRNWLNVTLQQMWKDGTYKKLYVKNYGEEPKFYMWSPTQLQPGI
jgi:polar amino acid transport system substrate-binding protein